MAKKIGDRAVIVTNGSGDPVTLLPGDDVPDWAEVGDHALETDVTRDEVEGGEPLQDKGTKIDGGAPEEGVPAPEDTPDPDLTGEEDDETPDGDAGAGQDSDEDATPDFTKPAARTSRSKK